MEDSPGGVEGSSLTVVQGMVLDGLRPKRLLFRMRFSSSFFTANLNKLTVNNIFHLNLYKIAIKLSRNKKRN